MTQDRLDLSSDPASSGNTRKPTDDTSKTPQQPEHSNTPDKKKFLGIKFTCCGIYTRIYVNRDGTAYEGRCPRCLKPIKLKIGEGGTDTRFFETF